MVASLENIAASVELIGPTEARMDAGRVSIKDAGRGARNGGALVVDAPLEGVAVDVVGVPLDAVGAPLEGVGA